MIDYRALAARRRKLGYRQLRSYVTRRPGEAAPSRPLPAGAEAEPPDTWRMVAPFSGETLPRFVANKLRYSVLYKTVGLVVVLLTLFVSSFVGIAVSEIRKGIKAVEKIMHPLSAVAGAPATKARENLVFLVLGCDDMKGERGRSDAMMLINVNLLDKKIRCLSVPRDSYVVLNHKGAHMDKINHAYFFGGPELSKETVQNYTGVSVDYYGVVNYQLFEAVVDLAGGVPIHVEKAMNYDDNAGDLHVHLVPGQQILDGVQAKGYVRFRHDANGDFGRMRRQQIFAKALLQRLKSPKVIAVIALNIRGLFDYVKTDVPMDLALGLLYHFKDFDPKNVEVRSIPSEPKMIYAPRYRMNLSFMLSKPEDVTASRGWLLAISAEPKAAPRKAATGPRGPEVEARIPNRAAQAP